jgi:hypothetical protein
VIVGDLTPDALHTIGFVLEASDRFQWDGEEDEVLANVIGDWSCPEINYQLTIENVHRFRAWLTRTEQYPAKPIPKRPRGKVVFVMEKKSVRE